MKKLNLNNCNYQKNHINWLVFLISLLVYTLFTITGYTYFYNNIPLIDVCAIILSTALVAVLITDYKTAFFTSILTGISDFLVFALLNHFFNQFINIYHMHIDLLCYFVFLALFIIVSFIGLAIGLILSHHENIKHHNTNNSRENISKKENIINEESPYKRLINETYHPNKTSKSKYCGHCGNKIENSENYCTSCGKKL